MTEASGGRTLAEVVAELYRLTNRMVEQRHDANFLIESVGRRQALMDEYDRLAARDPAGKAAYEREPAARNMIGKVIEMDKVLHKSLAEHKATAHKDVANANAAITAQQRMLDYLGGPRSGSRMDYKK